MDVASLGIEVQSTGTQKATADLNRLSVAAASAQANVEKLGRQRAGAAQSVAAAKATQDLARAAEYAARAEGKLEKAERAALKEARQQAEASTLAAKAKLLQARANETLAATELKVAQAALKAAQAQNDSPVRKQQVANDNSAGQYKHNTGNILAQFQDIGVTAAMGMNPLMIAVQQGTQLSSVLLTMDKPLRGLAAAFTGLIGVTSLLTIGVIALAAAFLQWVDWAKLASSLTLGLANSIQTLAPYLAAGAAALALWYGPGVIAGLASLTAYMIGFGAAALAAGAQAAAAWVIALSPVTLVVGMVGIAVATVLAALYVFRDQTKQIFGFDIVDVIKKSVNFIIGSFVAAAGDIELVWKNMPAIVGAATVGVANAVISGINAMVASAKSQLNILIDLANKIPGVNLDKMDPNSGGFDLIKNTYADQLKNFGADRVKMLNSAFSTDYLGKAATGISDGIGKSAEWASGKLKDLSKWLTTVDDKKKKKKGGKTDEEYYADIVNGAERQIETLKAERDAIGLSAEATARLKYETELLNKAKQHNLNLTPQQIEQLMQYADTMAKLEVETKKAKDLFEGLKDGTKSFASDLKQGLMDGEGFWKSFGNAALNALDRITDKLLNDVIDALFEVNSAASGSGGGLFGGLFSWIGGLFKNAKGNAFDQGSVKKFAKGGSFTNSIVTSPTLFKFAKGTGLMGEAGPEAIMPLSRGSDGKLGVSVNGASSSGSQSPQRIDLHVTSEVFVNDNGNWDAKVRDISQQVAEKTTAAGINSFSSKQLPVRVEQISKNPNRR